MIAYIVRLKIRSIIFNFTRDVKNRVCEHIAFVDKKKRVLGNFMLQVGEKQDSRSQIPNTSEIQEIIHIF